MKRTTLKGWVFICIPALIFLTFASVWNSDFGILFYGSFGSLFTCLALSMVEKYSPWWD